MSQKQIAVAVIGAGSSYTPELLDGFFGLDPARLPVSEFRLFDVETQRLGIMAGLAGRMARRRGSAVAVRSCSRIEDALEGAAFVVTQIRVGGMQARWLDESIPLRHGILGQETTGPGGMFKALRTIPAMLEIARTVERVAPQAFILNYTNPSGIVTEAVTRHTRAKILGLCSGIPLIIEEIKKDFGAEFPDLHAYCVGLNHLGFIHRIVSGGKDVTQTIIARMAATASRHGKDADALNQFAVEIGAVPIGYLDYYFRRGRLVRKLQAQEQTRAQQILELEKAVFAEAAAPGADTKPETLTKRGGGGYSAVTFAVMDAIQNDTGAEVALSVPNQGAVDGIGPEEVVEIVCRLGRHGATPIPVGAIPLAFRGLVHAVKAYEVLTIEAAMTHDRRLLKQALLNHPLVGDAEVIDPLLDEMIAAHRLWQA
jgi:6-phospho-beta-glucosidase